MLVRFVVDPSTVQLAAPATHTATLPDRYLVPPPAAPARYETATLELLALAPLGGTSFALTWPMRGAARRVSVVGAPVDTLVELSPLPWFAAPMLRALVPGAPTFYLGWSGGPDLPTDDQLVALDPVGWQVDQAFVGVLFQDRVALAPWAWIDLLGAALAQAGEAAAATAWLALAPLVAATRSLRVLDAQGRPAAGESFQIQVVGLAIPPIVGTSSAAGDLALPAIGPADRIELTWQPVAATGDVALPVSAAYEHALAAPTEVTARAIPVDGHRAITLPPGVTTGHVQVLDLARWLAPATPNPLHPIPDPPDPLTAGWPARFRPFCTTEPLVDGLPAFRRLVPDLKACRTAGGAAHLAGWVVQDFALLPDDPDSNLVALIEHIFAPLDPADPASHGEAHVLATRFLQLIDEAPAEIAGAVALGAAILISGGVLIGKGESATDKGGLAVWYVAVALSIIIYVLTMMPAGSLTDALEGLVEQTDPDLIEQLNSLPGLPETIALWARHPVAFADNPLTVPENPIFGLVDGLQDRFGVFHQKLQLIRRTRADGAPGFDHAGYLGGVDLHKNRRESPGHRGATLDVAPTALPRAAPFHDVHARITGPAVIDLFGTFADRHAYDAAQQDPPAPAPSFTAPSPGELPLDGAHLVQIARTAFGPGPGRAGFPWAPGGETTTRQTLMRAIAQAQEYIYIEDQYFTPDNEYVELLLDAAEHCKRLVILLPASPDQPFGEERRFAVLERLLTGTSGSPGWGARMVVGTPVGSAALAPASRSASHGRATLADMTAVPGAVDAVLFVTPATRVPDGAHHFVFVGGELMYVTKSELAAAPPNCRRLEVVRGGMPGQPPFCLHPRDHAAGEPVTFAAPRRIYVHSKIIMIDDVFVGIGSTNSNRRGFFHDGEICAFTVPDRLKAAHDNPARDLRAALWAEHLGLPPSAGRAVLADPIGAFELFRRSRYAGNRYTPFTELHVPRALDLNDVATALPGVPAEIEAALQVLLTFTVEANVPAIWNIASDPTTHADPNPTPGPEVQP